MKTITVTWNKLMDTEKQLVVALWNNQAFSICTDEKRNGDSFWSHCDIKHPLLHDEDKGPWDADASIDKKGRMVIVGADGPSGGSGKIVRVVLPLNVKIEIGAGVGR